MQTNNGTETTVRQTSKPHYPSRRDKSARAVRQRKAYQRWWRQQKRERESAFGITQSKPIADSGGENHNPVERAYLCECPGCRRRFYMTKA